MGSERWTLGRVFALGGVGLAGLLALLFWVVLSRSRESTLTAAAHLREQRAAAIASGLQQSLARAERPLDELARALEHGLVRADDADGLEAFLYRSLLAESDLVELSFTHARRLGFDADGAPQLAPEGRAQCAVERGMQPGAPLSSTRIQVDAQGGATRRVRRRAGGQGFGEGELSGPERVPDPTRHATFLTPASRAFAGQTLWSDLFWFAHEEGAGADERRVVVSVQRAIEDGAGAFAGVMRAALLADELTRRVAEAVEEGDPHRVVLCDARGRLIAASQLDGRIRADAGDLRLFADSMPEELALLLAQPQLAQARPAGGRFVCEGEAYQFTFRPLPDTQDWIVGVVVPEQHYLGELSAIRRGLVAVVGVVGLVILLANLGMLRLLRGNLARIDACSGELERFDFEPRSPRGFALAEVRRVIERLELAKTAMRAMGRYVSLDLVRQLYRERKEPELGGEPRRVSLFFSDIEGFTSLAERVPPDELARLLGLYLECMTAAVHETGGLVDKYIGDAVMALWNAPEEQAQHAQAACRAALLAQARTAARMRAADWGAEAPFVTRIGLHTDEVLVGHFGAPERMNYTALGDGVNLAVRLEGLNKQYGTRILASEALVETVGEAFAFRQIDRVAVKGKERGVGVFELLGEGALDPALAQRARAYEAALQLYFERRFADAQRAFEALEDDPPARALAARCAEYVAQPPAEDWRGVYHARAK